MYPVWFFSPVIITEWHLRRWWNIQGPAHTRPLGVRGQGYSPMMWNGNTPQVSKETFSSHTPHRQLPPQLNRVQQGGVSTLGLFSHKTIVYLPVSIYHQLHLLVPQYLQCCQKFSWCPLLIGKQQRIHIQHWKYIWIEWKYFIVYIDWIQVLIIKQCC